jgi:hypothetical protein
MTEPTLNEATPRRRKGRSDRVDSRGLVGKASRTPSPTSEGSITQGHSSSHAGDISPKQHRAIELLIAGKNDTQVAADIGVSREIVNRWRHHHPPFVAALNAERLSLWHASRERLRALGDKAFDVLDVALDRGDTRVALGLLKLRAADPAPAGATDLRGAVLELAQRLRVESLIEALGVDRDDPVLRDLQGRWLGSDNGAATERADDGDDGAG